jgi:hypothetical protein
MPPESVLDRVHDIEKLDRMARRNYGLSDKQEKPCSLDLHVLAGRVRTLIAIESHPDAVNTMSTQTACIAKRLIVNPYQSNEGARLPRIARKKRAYFFMARGGCGYRYSH